MFSVNVEQLNIYDMGITEIPDLSNERIIRHIICFNNQLKSLPPLPPNLITLSCYNNQLTSLPPLPSTLQTLICHHNQLTSLPPLPQGLSHLDCSNNQLTSLPILSGRINENYGRMEGLKILNCSNNKLTSLPPLPISLNELFCSNNQLTSLPSGGSLFKVSCINNPLTSLPTFPNHHQPTTIIFSKKNDLLKSKKNMRIINKFKHLYYSLKFKKHFIKLLKKSRERKSNKTNRIIIAILLIIVVIVVIMLMMRNTKQYLSNKLPSSSTDTYEINISLMISILHVICSTFWKLYWR